MHQRISSNNPCHNMDSCPRLTHHAATIENSPGILDWFECGHSSDFWSFGVTERELHTTPPSSILQHIERWEWAVENSSTAILQVWSV
jgi:hypothetical protein